MSIWTGLFDGARQQKPAARIRLSLESLDGRDLPSVAIGEPPNPPPGSTAPPTTDAAYDAYLAQVDAAEAVFTTTFGTTLQQFYDTATAAADQASAQIQPLVTSYEAVETQQQATVDAVNEAAYTVYEAAWQAAAGDPSAQQLAYDTYIATVQAAATQANAVIDAASVTMQAGVQTALSQMDATLGTASLACQVAVENAAQVFLASEQAAWAALPPAIEGSGGAVPSPQAVTYADPQQPRRPIGRGGIIDRIRGAAEGWKPVPVFPPKPGDPVQVWPPAIKIIGNKPKLIPIFEGPRGGTVGIVRGGVGVYLPPAIVVTSPGPFIRFPSGIIVKGVIGAEVGITGPKVAPKVIVEVPRP